jgi:hypothetical protein
MLRCCHNSTECVMYLMQYLGGGRHSTPLFWVSICSVLLAETAGYTSTTQFACMIGSQSPNISHNCISSWKSSSAWKLWNRNNGKTFEGSNAESLVCAVQRTSHPPTLHGLSYNDYK